MGFGVLLFFPEEVINELQLACLNTNMLEEHQEKYPGLGEKMAEE